MIKRIRRFIRGLLPGQIRPAADRVYDYVRWLFHCFTYHFHKKTFSINGRTYRYFLHYYNNTWGNERAVEVPFVWDIVKKAKEEEKKVLEIGNVLSNYFSIGHDVIDKYEKSNYPRLLNVDFNDFNPSEKYDLIVSISTFEHIGKIDPPEFRGKVVDAVRHARKLLAPGGTAVITVPAGYNEFLDRAIKDGRISFSKTVCMERHQKRNEWKETTLETALGKPYIRPFPGATGLIIGYVMQNDGKQV
jgi:SAM-dependent methyltransferase